MVYILYFHHCTFMAMYRCSMINVDPDSGDTSGVALRVLAGYRRQRANILFGQFLSLEVPKGNERETAKHFRKPNDTTAGTTSNTANNIHYKEDNDTDKNSSHGVRNTGNAADGDGGSSVESFEPPGSSRTYRQAGAPPGQGVGSALNAVGDDFDVDKGIDEWKGWVWEGMEVSGFAEQA